MFLRLDNIVVNLKSIEMIKFCEDSIFIGMSSGGSLSIDLKHADKLEHAIIHFNEQGGYARP